MLRKIRITLAAVFFIGITLLLIGIGEQWFGWMAKLQFLPSCLALNFTVIVGILLLVFVFGRIYCSVICPLGVFQDLIIKLRPKKKKFKYNPERTWIRVIVTAFVIASAIVFGQLIISLLAPYSAYGRIVSSLVGLVNGGVSVALLVTGGVSLVGVGLCAYLWGRAYCNTICPVGTVLGLVSRHSLFRPVIDKEKCVHCGQCVKKCKASCIDGENRVIDGSRCVVCFDCLGNCKVGAISYKFVGFGSRHCKDGEAISANTADEGRRKFLTTGAVVIGAGVAASAQNLHLDGGLAEVLDKKSPERSCRIVPPGSLSVKNFYDHCTSCQLCVDNCPNDVLRPSTDLEHFLQPVMGYEKGYCRPECNICSTLCPSGAIHPIQKEEKLNIRIGKASVNAELCLAANGEAGCGNCVRHCPSGALRMLTVDGKRQPVVNEELCIGCGACEYLCPARPISAITVNGLSTHIDK